MTNIHKSLTPAAIVFGSPVFTAVYFLPFLKPDYVNKLVFVPDIFDLLLFFSIAIGLVMLFTSKMKIAKHGFAILGYFAVVLTATIFNNGTINSAIINCMKPFLFIIGIYYGAKTNKDVLLNTLDCLLSIIIIINFFTIIMQPGGLYVTQTDNSYSAENWFIGFKNVHIRTILPGVTLTIVNGYRKYNKITIRSFIMIGIMVLSSILINSSTAIIGSVVFVLMMLIFSFKKLAGLFDVRIIIIVTVFIFFAIYLFNAQNMFSFFIENILGKDLTLSNRLRLWYNTIQQFFIHPVTGVGIQSKEFMYGVIGASHPHDYLLYILLTGGLVGVLFVGRAYFIVGKKLAETKTSIVSKCFQSMIISFMVMGITESLTSTTLLYPFLFLSYYPEWFDSSLNI